ncbi:hypothetical protein VD0004_g4376 [Verticillium dahliae]|nr:hypothetical protein VD0004_g4376 [Verticillium dahliae]PNH76638.1 hypothetical protein VD0001_g935 [Verticillium dahliae]
MQANLVARSVAQVFEVDGWYFDCHAQQATQVCLCVYLYLYTAGAPTQGTPHELRSPLVCR